MASRSYITHTVTSTAPPGAQAGDEYYNPTTNVLYKDLVANGATPGFNQVVFVNNSGIAVVTGNVSATGNVTGNYYVGNGIFTNIAETTTITATAATGTVAYYPSVQSVLYSTANATANWTVNLTFSSSTTLNTVLGTGQSLTVAHLVTQGSPAFYANVIQVDGTTSGVTTKWQSAAPTSGNASSLDVYSYTVIKTGLATFTVLASQTKFV